MSRVLSVSLVAALSACFSPPARHLSAPQQARSEAPRDQTPERVARAAEPAETSSAPTPARAPAPRPTRMQPRPEPRPEPAAEPKPHPLAELEDQQLEKMLLEDPESLGAISLGLPNAGALFNGQQMPEGERWDIVNPRETWGTPETIDYLITAIDAVHEKYPDAPPVHIGDISDRDGGHLAPHISHQSGRDVDIGFYYETDADWYTRARAGNLDLDITWTFVRALVTRTDIEMIFIDRSLQKLLKEHALSIGEDPAWLDDLFGGPLATMRPIIRHEPGHKTHIHARFYNPVAQETGRRVYRMMIANKMIKPPTYYVKHKVRRGDTLIRIARKYRTSVQAIKKANRLRTSRIYANHTYKIPRRGGVRLPDSLELPERRLPPPPAQRDARVSDARGGEGGEGAVGPEADKAP